MAWLRKTRSPLRALFAKRQLDAEMNDEMRSHIEMQTQENLDNGMPPEETRHAALRQFGHVDGIKETARDQREGFVTRHLALLAQDVSFAIRQLRKSPAFTAVVILTLAVAIGATSAIHAVVKNTILDPLPVQNADALMSVLSFHPKHNIHGAAIDQTDLLELRVHEDIFADLAVYRFCHVNFRGPDSAGLVSGVMVSPRFFALWHTPPDLGRLFTVDEHQFDTRSVILSHRFWHSALGGDEDVIGKSIQLEGEYPGTGLQGYTVQDYTVVGVMPKHFQFPHATVALWIPEPGSAGPALRGDSLNAEPPRNFRVIFRLPEHVQSSQVQALLDTISARRAADDPHSTAGRRLEAHPLSDMFADAATRRTLWTLFAVAGLVWLIACVNTANLFLARAEARQHEIAIRNALGAKRSRLIRQMLTESLLLAVLAGLAGLALTDWSIQTLESFSSGIRLKPVELNWQVFGSSMTLAMITGILFGLAPAWQTTSPRLHGVLQQAGSSARQGGRSRSPVRGLIVAQVALATVLLSAAGLMTRSVLRVLSVDVGFRPDNLLIVDANPYVSQTTLSDRQVTLFMDQLRERIRMLPGVVSLGTATGFVSREDYIGNGEDRMIKVAREDCGVGRENPFETRDVPLIEGRFLDLADRDRNTVVVNQALARSFWPEETAVGKHFRSLPTPGKSPEEWQVVGVVGDTRLYNGQVVSLERDPRPMFFRPYDETLSGVPASTLYIRSAGDPTALVRPIQTAINELAPTGMDSSIKIASEELRHSTQERRAYTFYLSLVAAVGLALAAIGLYGLLAYSVARRTREIGIRMAIGATRISIHNLILCEGMKLVCIGLAIGLTGALMAGRILQNQLFDVSPQDPATLAVISIVLLGATAMACSVPAFRAACVNPMEALQDE